MERLSFQDLLRRSFISYISIVAAAAVLLFLGGFAIYFAAAVVGSNRANDRSLSQTFDEQYAAYDSGLQELCQSPELRALLAGGGPAEQVAVNQLLYRFTNAQRSFKSYFVLLDREGAVVCSNLNESNQSTFASSSFARSMCLRLERGPEELMCFVCPVSLSSEQRCCWSLCRAVLGEDGAPAGYLTFLLREESFREHARAIPQDVLITDRYDNIIYTTLYQEKDPMDKLPSGKYALDLERHGVVKLDRGYCYVSVSSVTPQGLQFYTVTSLDMQVRTLWYALLLFLGLFLVLIAIVALLTRTFAQRNAREIGELTRAVEELDRGSEDYQLSPQCSAESQQLYSQFRSLTLHLRELIRHNSELQDRRRQMEVKQLEEQFNPHFVFNVMETVRFQIGEDPEAAAGMLLSFASLMRYSINYGHTKVSLETDVEYVNDYLLLQKVRYNNCLRYEFHIPDELLDCQVPKLLLQPLIENSIRHGYCQGKVLEIGIEARQEGDDLHFTVRDNGAGIEPSRLAAIRETLTMELDSPAVARIGLYNVHKMLGLLYGPEYGIQIHSVPGEGTVVQLRMPYETEEAEPC